MSVEATRKIRHDFWLGFFSFSYRLYVFFDYHPLWREIKKNHVVLWKHQSARDVAYEDDAESDKRTYKYRSTPTHENMGRQTFFSSFVARQNYGVTT